MGSRPLLSALRAAHAHGIALREVPQEWKPATLDDAYAIADELAVERGAVAGWKVGATSAHGQTLLGLEQPFFGRIFASTVHRGGRGAHVPHLRAGRRTLALEPEIVFVIGRDLEPRAAPRTPEEVYAAVEAVAAGIEVNWPAYEQPFAVGGRCLIADNGVNAGLIVGASTEPPGVAELAALEVEVWLDEASVGRGRGEAVLGNPLRALEWLAAALSARGRALERGQYVASGAMLPSIVVGAGRGDAQRLRAVFDGLGSLEVAIGT